MILFPTSAVLCVSAIYLCFDQNIYMVKQFGGFGALHSCSTTHALTDILHLWHEVLDKHQSVTSVFVDCESHLIISIIIMIILQK